MTSTFGFNIHATIPLLKARKGGQSVTAHEQQLNFKENKSLSIAGGAMFWLLPLGGRSLPVPELRRPHQFLFWEN